MTMTSEERRARTRVAEVIQVYGGIHARDAYERDVKALEALRRIVKRSLACGQLEKLEDARPYLDDADQPAAACTCGPGPARWHERSCPMAKQTPQGAPPICLHCNTTCHHDTCGECCWCHRDLAPTPGEVVK